LSWNHFNAEDAKNTIDIQDKGIVYLPVWCAEGSKGVMLVDATTGNVIREDPFKK